MNNMLIALQITALGMGLVFGAIVLLWGMMSLLTSLTADKPSAKDPVEDSAEKTSTIDDTDFKAQAAVAAVAIALAAQQASTGHLFTEPPPAIVSAWQLGMRTRQMYQKGVSIGRRVR